METIKYIYEKFILRDLLAFVTPGAIVLFSILFNNTDLTAEKILKFPGLANEIVLLKNSLVQFIVFFVFAYIVGLTIACLAYGIFGTSKKDKLFRFAFNQKMIEKHFEKMVGIYNSSKSNNHILCTRERFVILKEASLHNMVGFGIAIILNLNWLINLNRIKNYCIYYIIFGLFLFLLGLFSYINRNHQDKFENKI